MSNKKVPLSNTARNKRSVAKYRKAGLIQAKVWVHPDESDKTRSYAAKQPLTKPILKALRDGS